MPTSTFTADSGGRGNAQNTDAVYATCRNASSASAAIDSAGLVQSAAAYSIIRFFAPFDLTSPTSGSAIPSGATINSAFIRLPGVATDFTNDNSDSLVIVSSTQASNTALVQNDYDQSGSTSFGTLTLASYNTAGNNDITLNASGLTNISGGSFSKFAIKMNTRDLGNTAPTGNNTVRFTASGVVLSVDWTAPALAGGIFFI